MCIRMFLMACVCLGSITVHLTHMQGPRRMLAEFFIMHHNYSLKKSLMETRKTELAINLHFHFSINTLVLFDFIYILYSASKRYRNYNFKIKKFCFGNFASVFTSGELYWQIYTFISFQFTF